MPKKQYDFCIDVMFGGPVECAVAVETAMHKSFKNIMSMRGESFLRFKSSKSISLLSEKEFCQKVKSVIEKVCSSPCEVNVCMQHVPKAKTYKAKIKK